MFELLQMYVLGRFLFQNVHLIRCEDLSLLMFDALFDLQSMQTQLERLLSRLSTSESAPPITPATANGFCAVCNHKMVAL